MTRKRLSLPVLIVAIIAIVAATSGGAQKRRQDRPGGASAISVRQTAVGKALVDANGRTLYLFEGDKRNVSRLSAAGRAVWPPVTATRRPAATRGTSATRIATISSTRQVTYNGHPLYYYVGDQRPGQISGQGLYEFGARWYMLSASGAPITSTARSGSGSQAGTSSPYGEGTGYGY